MEEDGAGGCATALHKNRQPAPCAGCRSGIQRLAVAALLPLTTLAALLAALLTALALAVLAALLFAWFVLTALVLLLAGFLLSATTLLLITLRVALTLLLVVLLVILIVRHWTFSSRLGALVRDPPGPSRQSGADPSVPFPTEGSLRKRLKNKHNLLTRPKRRRAAAMRPLLVPRYQFYTGL